MEDSEDSNLTPEKPEEPEALKPNDSTELNAKWQLTSATDANGESISYENINYFSLEIDNNSLYGTTNCNSFFGGVEYSKEAHSFSVPNGLGATMMYCEDSQGEDMINFLNTVETYELKEEVLKLKLDSEVYTFVKKTFVLDENIGRDSNIDDEIITDPDLIPELEEEMEKEWGNR